LQEKLPAFKASGASLITITTETPDNSLNTLQKHNLEFEVLSDQGNNVTREFGLVFQMMKELSDLYYTFEMHIDQHNGDDNYEHPLPATYVVECDGKLVSDS